MATSSEFTIPIAMYETTIVAADPFRARASDITIVPIGEGEIVRAVAALHSRVFAGYLNVSLGMGYMLAFFTWFVHANNAIAIAAVNGRQEVVGYAVGAPVGYGRELNLQLFWSVLFRVLFRPSLWFNTKFWTVVKARIRTLLSSGTNQYEESGLPGPTMALVAVGTSPDQWRNGIGSKLMKVFTERAEELKMRSISLSVYEENVAARSLYEKCGWHARRASKEPNEVMKYFLLLPQRQSPSGEASQW